MNKIGSKGLLLTDPNGTRVLEINQDGIYINGTLREPRKFFGKFLIKASDMIKKMAYATN